MNIYTVAFFGHRYIDNMYKIEEKLEPILKDLINQKQQKAESGEPLSIIL